jgi:hypothetical protein
MQIHMKTLLSFLLLAVIVVCINTTCKPIEFRKSYTSANELLYDSSNLLKKPFLKAHMRNGDVYVFSENWTIDTIKRNVSGQGKKFDFNRKLTFEGAIVLPIDSVVIFETNIDLKGEKNKQIAGVALLAGADAALGIYCYVYPKACFGSCPTFYINPDHDFHFADAEGFSNAISPVMEYADIDALNNSKLHNAAFTLTMKNEALETHCVNNVQLFAFPRAENQRIFQTPNDQFYLCENITAPVAATADEGDVLKMVLNKDLIERWSPADANNLCSKETIYLNFENINNTRKGLILNFRQTLMTTYFIYNAISYMGDEMGDIFAKLETDPAIREKLSSGIKKELGGIEVYVLDAVTNKWILQSQAYETGPIAINQQFFPLDSISGNENVKIKIVLNKGLWRLDYAALANIIDEVSPIVINPNNIKNNGNNDADALQNILEENAYLIAMPGNEFEFTFLLPNTNTDYELFLKSSGYYLEWMRAEWLADKNLPLLHQMVEQPKKYLKNQASAYKKYELEMEGIFWNSKIDTKAFTYYED